MQKRTANPNSSLSMPDVLARLKVERPDLWSMVEIVGRWVWISFDAKPADSARAYLKALGFHWSRRRSAWQHSCGIPSRHSATDPRFRYGSVRPADVDRETVVA